jgi:hypothetical protein
MIICMERDYFKHDDQNAQNWFLTRWQHQSWKLWISAIHKLYTLIFYIKRPDYWRYFPAHIYRYTLHINIYLFIYIYSHCLYAASKNLKGKFLTNITLGCLWSLTNIRWRPILDIGWSGWCNNGNLSWGVAGRCWRVFSHRRCVIQYLKSFYTWTVNIINISHIKSQHNQRPDRSSWINSSFSFLIYDFPLLWDNEMGSEGKDVSWLQTMRDVFADFYDIVTYSGRGLLLLGNGT